MSDVDKIYGRLLEIYAIAKAENISVSSAGDKFAEKRIEIMRNVRANFIKR